MVQSEVILSPVKPNKLPPKLPKPVTRGDRLHTQGEDITTSIFVRHSQNIISPLSQSITSLKNIKQINTVNSNKIINNKNNLYSGRSSKIQKAILS